MIRANAVTVIPGIRVSVELEPAYTGVEEFFLLLFSLHVRHGLMPVVINLLRDPPKLPVRLADWRSIIGDKA